MRKLLVSLLAVAIVATFAAQALAARKRIKVGDNYFVRRGDPPTVSVAKGTRVTWRWVGDGYHEVRVKKGPVKFHSDLKPSGRYTKKMRKRGTYRIVCRVHAPSMRMKLVVY